MILPDCNAVLCSVFVGDCIKQYRNIARQYACFYRVFQVSANQIRPYQLRLKKGLCHKLEILIYLM